MEHFLLCALSTTFVLLVYHGNTSRELCHIRRRQAEGCWHHKASSGALSGEPREENAVKRKGKHSAVHLAVHLAVQFFSLSYFEGRSRGHSFTLLRKRRYNFNFHLLVYMCFGGFFCFLLSLALLCHILKFRGGLFLLREVVTRLSLMRHEDPIQSRCYQDTSFDLGLECQE